MLKEAFGQREFGIILFVLILILMEHAQRGYYQHLS